MSSSSKSSRAGYESSKSSDGSRARLSRVSKSQTHDTTTCDEEIIIPFHRLDSPDPMDDQQQQTPHTIAFKETLSSAFVAAPVQLTESSSLSCATSTADSSDHTDSYRNSLPSKQRPGARVVKPLSHERVEGGDPHGHFETFVSQRGNKDAEWGGPTGTSPRPRPNSANSIVNVMKIVTTHTAEATQLIQKHFNICGSSNENEEQQEHDVQIPFKFMSLTGKASPKQAHDPTIIVHESIEYPFISSVEAMDENSTTRGGEILQRSSMEDIPFQRSSGSAFGRVGSGCSLQSISGQNSSVVDPTLSVSRLRSSRGGPSLFLSSSASDVSSSCSGASTSITRDLYNLIPSSQRGDSNVSSISARAQHSIKNKRRQKRQRDSKSRSSCDATEATSINSSLPRTEQTQPIALSSVDEENTVLNSTMESYDVETLDHTMNDDHEDPPFETSYEMAADENFPSLPVYYKLEDDDQDLIKVSRSNRTQNRKKVSATTPRRHEAIVLPLPHNQSPNSMDGSQSPLTIKSFNTSVQSTNSGLSVGSSVIAADREVMEVNRSRLRQAKISGDVDGSMSIHSSDSASTQAYVALVGGSFPREGASLRVDQFFQGEHFTMENGHGPRVNHDSSSNSIANKSFSSDESSHYASVYPQGHSFLRRPLEEDYDDDVVSYSKLRSSCEDKPIALDSVEKKARHRRGVSKVEESPSDVRLSSSLSLKDSVIVSNPVSPPSRFLDSHPLDYLHEKGASKPSVVRHCNYSIESSFREKIDFFSKGTKNRDSSSKAVTTSKVVGQGSFVHDATTHSTESSLDPCAIITPDK